MCVHRRCVVRLWAVEYACTDIVLCGCERLKCVQRRCVVRLWRVECAFTIGVLCGCGQINVRAQTVCCVSVGS